MDNILAAIDFSDVSPMVIEEAATIAQSFASKLWLIHVAAPDSDFVSFDTGPQCERDWKAQVLREEHRYIQDAALALEQRGINVTPLLIQGATIDTILQEASKLQAEMIVMGSHGHGALYKAIVGSVSEGVIRKAVCPVLIVPARKKQYYPNQLGSI